LFPPAILASSVPTIDSSSLPSLEGVAADDDEQDIIDKADVTNGNEEIDDLAACRDEANIAIGSDEEADHLAV
jgi:hypothetical protein